MLEAKFNSVDYDIPTNLSVVKERTFKQFPPVDQRPIPSNPITGEPSVETNFRLAIGNYEFVDMWSSWLEYDVQPRANCYQSQYMFSLADFVKTITIMDRNNVEIERITDINLLNSMIATEKFGRNYIDNVCHSTKNGQFYNTNYAPGVELFSAVPPDNIYPGTLQDVKWEGRDNYTIITTTPPPIIASGSVPKTYRVAIPMALLAGLFSTDKLLPPHLLSGMIINIQWARAQDILYPNVNFGAGLRYEPEASGEAWQNYYDFNGIPTPVPIYTISNVGILLDCFTIHQSIVDQITEAFNGIVGIPIAFQSYTQVIQSRLDLAKQTLSIPIYQSFSNASKIVGTTRIRCGGLIGPSDQVFPTEIDCTATIPYLMGQPYVEQAYQLRFNGISYPDKPVTNQTTAYNLWMAAFGKVRLYDSVAGVSYNEFVGNMGSTFVLDLSRAGYNFSLSGGPVNTQANFIRSGQRIDGTNPATLQLVLGDATQTASKFEFAIVEEPYEEKYRVLSAWVEHERILLCKSIGNRILV